MFVLDQDLIVFYQLLQLMIEASSPSLNTCQGLLNQIFIPLSAGVQSHKAVAVKCLLIVRPP